MQILSKLIITLITLACAAQANGSKASIRSTGDLFRAIQKNPDTATISKLQTSLPSTAGNSLFKSVELYAEQDYNKDFADKNSGAIGLKFDFYPLYDYRNQKRSATLSLDYSRLRLEAEKSQQNLGIFELIVDTESVLAKKRLLSRFGSFLEKSKSAVDEFVEKGNGSPKSLLKVHKLMTDFELDQIRTYRQFNQLSSRLEGYGVVINDIDSVELISEEKISDVLQKYKDRKETNYSQRLLELESDLKLEKSLMKSNLSKQWFKGIDIKANTNRDSIDGYTMQLTFNIPPFSGGSPIETSEIVADSMDSIKGRREAAFAQGSLVAEKQEIMKLLEILKESKKRKVITDRVMKSIAKKVVSNDLELFLEIQSSAYESEIQYIELRQEVLKKYLFVLYQSGILATEEGTDFLSNSLEKL